MTTQLQPTGEGSPETPFHPLHLPTYPTLPEASTDPQEEEGGCRESQNCGSLGATAAALGDTVVVTGSTVSLGS